jgi:hypothetical protein
MIADAKLRRRVQCLFAAIATALVVVSITITEVATGGDLTQGGPKVADTLLRCEFIVLVVGYLVAIRVPAKAKKDK